MAAATVVVGFLGYEVESVAPPIAAAAASSTAMARSTVKSSGEVDGLEGSRGDTDDDNNFDVSIDEDIFDGLEEIVGTAAGDKSV